MSDLLVEKIALIDWEKSSLVFLVLFLASLFFITFGLFIAKENWNKVFSSQEIANKKRYLIRKIGWFLSIIVYIIGVVLIVLFFMWVIIFPNLTFLSASIRNIGILFCILFLLIVFALSFWVIDRFLVHHRWYKIQLYAEDVKDRVNISFLKEVRNSIKQIEKSFIIYPSNLWIVAYGGDSPYECYTYFVYYSLMSLIDNYSKRNWRKYLSTSKKIKLPTYKRIRSSNVSADIGSAGVFKIITGDKEKFYEYYTVREVSYDDKDYVLDIKQYVEKYNEKSKPNLEATPNSDVF